MFSAYRSTENESGIGRCSFRSRFSEVDDYVSQSFQFNLYKTFPEGLLNELSQMKDFIFNAISNKFPAPRSKLSLQQELGEWGFKKRTLQKSRT